MTGAGGCGGWVKIWRGMMASCTRRRFGLELCGAMVWLILEAAYQRADDPLFGRLEPGDVPVSLRRLEAEWHLSLRQVRLVVETLVASGFMSCLRVLRRWGTVYRIANYAKYQGIASPFRDDAEEVPAGADDLFDAACPELPEAAADGEEPPAQSAPASVPRTQHGTLGDCLRATPCDGKSSVSGTQHGTLPVCARTRVLSLKEEEEKNTDRPARAYARPTARPSGRPAAAAAAASPSPARSAGGVSFDWDGDCDFHGEKLALAVSLWKGAYPALDVDAELSKARTWLADNASQGLRREDVRLWLAHWMQKAERLRRASETRSARISRGAGGLSAAASASPSGAAAAGAAAGDYSRVAQDAALMGL